MKVFACCPFRKPHPSLVMPLEDEERVAEGEYLGLERGPAVEQGSEHPENGQKGRRPP